MGNLWVTLEKFGFLKPSKKFNCSLKVLLEVPNKTNAIKAGIIVREKMKVSTSSVGNARKNEKSKKKKKI